MYSRGHLKSDVDVGDGKLQVADDGVYDGTESAPTLRGLVLVQLEPLLHDPSAVFQQKHRSIPCLITPAFFPAT